MDSLRTLAKKGSDIVVGATAKVGQYIDEKSGVLVNKIPGGSAFAQKASLATQASVDRIGKESKEIIKEGEEMLEKHKKVQEAEAAFKQATAPETTQPSLAQQIQQGIRENSK